MVALTIVTKPKETPVSLDEAKQHLREDDPTGSNDAIIRSLIEAATKQAEHYTRRALITQTWDMWIDKFSDPLEVPKPPLQSISFIKYLDSTGTLTTHSNSPQIYKVDTDGIKGNLYLTYSQVWPATYDEPKAVNIRFIAGYGTAEDVPEGIKQAIKMMVSHWYEFREPVIVGGTPMKMPMAVEALLDPYRVLTL